MKKLFLLLLTTIFFSCNNNDDTTATTTPTPATSSYDKGNAASRNFHGLILDTSGNPVSNATVTIGSTTVQTTSNGLFNVTNASVNERFAHIKVTKSGFVDGSRVLVPTSGDNRINIMLIPDVATNTITTGAPSQVSIPGVTVKFSGSFKDASGNPYTGNVQVGLYHLKPSNTYLNEIMPGSLLASNTAGEAKVLETFGMLHVSLKGSGGQKLNLATNTTAEISLDIETSQTATSPATIPLWSFDEVSGIWKEEGSATKTGNKYIGNVSHFSWWNFDTPFPYTTLSVNVQNPANIGIGNLTVSLSAANDLPRNGITNGSGTVSGLVPANEVLTIKISDLCGNIVYTGSIGPFAAGATIVLPTIILSNSALNTITIIGDLQTCANANVTNGLVRLKNTSTTNYFSEIVQPVTNGTFSINTNICGASQQFKLIGEDITNLQSSSQVTFTATSPLTTVGVINTCNSISEFINYKLDNNPTRFISTGINANITTSGISIQAQGSPLFSLLTNSFNTVGTYTTNFSMEFTGIASSNNFFNATGNNVQWVISQIGTVGGYIDFTINGTYLDPNGLNHTITATGHVIRVN